MKQRRWLRPNGATLLLVLAAAALGVAAKAAPDGQPDDAKDVPPMVHGRGGKGGKGGRGAGAPVDVTDAQVVASMQKGIDFLLSQKKNDNWEVPGQFTHGNGEVGGVTAIALYALLHAGESLQDDPAYHAKLNWRGKELAPAIAWLSRNMPVDTYVAGLEASALTLVPHLRDEKLTEGTGPALEACKWYLLQAMGGDGGYTYSMTDSKFPAAWAAYFAAALKGNRQGAERKALDLAAKAEYRRFGGPELELQKMAVDLETKLKTAKTNQERARIQAEMSELDNYARQLPGAQDVKKLQADAQAKLDDLLRRNGNPQGLTTATGKKKTPMTREEMAAEITRLQKQIKQYEEELQTSFTPLGDLSNGQYGTLGAWALADSGIELPNRYWEVQDRFWRLMQQADGSWPYSRAANDTRPTMGLAGIASLFIAQEFVDTQLRLLPKPDKNLDTGLAWLDKDFKPSTNLYYMYGVERVGLNSGLKFFGTADWYKEGAAVVVKSQAADGSWSYHSPAVGTSYALLFLARGRNPVAFNKLQYNGPWNARPRDDAYITRWMSKELEKPINWQVVNLQVSPDEWMDAPVLLITGSQDPRFTKDDIDKLRQYVNAGGMIFSTADGNSLAFTNAIKKYAAEVVSDKYEMRQFPRNHELFSKEMGVDMPNPPPIYGISNGVRELWIHSTRDVGADWQMRRYASKNSFQLGEALYFYASGMGSLRSKLQSLVVAPGAAPVRTINVALIDYSGNSDPEPGAWPRMAKLAQADFKTGLTLATVKFADLDAKKYPIAHLTGTAKVTFTGDEVNAARAYVDAGGLLFIDAAGGNAEFAASARDLIKQVYGEKASAHLVPDDSPLITGSMPDGKKIDDVEFRKYGNLTLKRRVTSPLLEEVVTNGRTRILFSQWDICSGFLGTNTWGIVGYAPATAEDLARNILLYAQNPVEAASAAAKGNP